MKIGRKLSISALCLAGLFLPGPAAVRAQSKGEVVEQIVARVNNQIITLSDYEKARDSLRQEVAQDCQSCSQDKIQTLFKERDKDLLRDLIDQQLLIERAKDMNISVDTQVIKQLDDVRKQNNLASIDDLEKAVEAQGLSWEEYKNQIRNRLLTDEVIGQEVGGRIDISGDDVKKFYETYKNDFILPEQVVLAEIFLSTEGKSPEDMVAIQMKAEDLHRRVVRGDDFSEIAKRYSQGPTAKDGGGLGIFEHGQLSKDFEDAVFKMEKGQITDVIQTKTGFEILKIVEHFQSGLQPLEKVEDSIANKLRMQRMEPAMRKYLAELREESYVMVKPGYTDSAAVAGATIIQEVSPTPDTAQKGKKKKLPIPKVNGQ